MSKPIFILIPGFGSNQYILKRYVDIISNTFEVKVIDLPGLDKSIAYEKPIKLSELINYAQTEINNIQTEYVICGLSMGYYIVNNLKLNIEYCRGIIALLPFLGTDYLNKSPKNSKSSKLILKGLLKLKQEKILWERTKFKKFLAKTLTNEEVEIAIETIDSYAYFNIGKQLLDIKHIKPRNDFKTILIINQKDEMINYTKTLASFENNVKKLMVINTNLSHYSNRNDNRKIEESLSNSTMQKAINFLS